MLLNFLLLLKQRYNDPSITVQYLDEGGQKEGYDFTPPFSVMNFKIFDENNRGICYWQTIGKLKQIWNEEHSITICIGYHNSVIELDRRHIWLEIDGIPVDSDPHYDATKHLKIAEFNLR